MDCVAPPLEGGATQSISDLARADSWLLRGIFDRRTTNPSLSAIAIARSKSTAGLVCKHGSKCAACCENAKGPCSPAQSCSRAVPTHARAYSQHTPGPALSGRCHNA